METTFALIKPDCAGNNTRKSILHDIMNAGFRITSLLNIQFPTEEQVDAHLADLKILNIEAYNRNKNYLVMGPVTALKLEKENAIEDLRSLIGETDPSKAKVGTLRCKYGKDSIEKATKEKRGLKNAIHASDSQESAIKEINIWIRNL